MAEESDATDPVLQAQVAVLEQEIDQLRRRLADAPKRQRALEERLLETKGQLAQAVSQNEKLSYTLREAREHIASLRDEVDKLTQPPSAYGVIVGKNDDGTVDVLTSGRKMRVGLHPDIDHEELPRGSEVVLNESFNVVQARRPEVTGEVVAIKELLDDGVRALVIGRADEERVCELADSLRGVHLRSGDTMRLDPRTNMLLEKLPRPEVEDLLLEEVPDISYSDIGGLDTQIEQIADAVELPFLYHDLFAEHQLPAPKGILLYGPPGCGKTLIAKAVELQLKGHLGFPVYYPKLAKLGSSYMSDPATPNAYTIRDRAGKKYRAYRMVAQAPGFGQYYGIQGTSWMSPPIIDNPDETRRMRHRDYMVFYDGRSIRLVAWRTPRAVYWVSNTLSESLSNKQMLGIARSLSRIGS